MKAAILPLAAAVALAACSDSQPAPDPAPDNVSPVAVNGVEDVPVSEGDAVADPAAVDATDAAGPVAAQGQDAYLGRWIGVEGMYLTVAAKPGGGVTLDMQWDLENRGTFDGSVTAEGLRFLRNGVAETAVLTDGQATGLKWLADEKTCLTVKPGEGYCRD